MKKINKIFLIVGITLAVALLLMTIGNKMKADAIKEKQDAENYNEWLAENCNCLVKEKITCPTGFEILDKLCYNSAKGIYTSRVIKCSEYNCSGEIKIWNNETGKWEDKVNG
jgi:hypothetical protein